MFGNGSDGSLTVASGSTSLPLNTRHQFTTVNVASGATLTTSDTSGSVMYISATTSITIDGTIDLSNKVQPGDYSGTPFPWEVYINGQYFNTPGTKNGGAGGLGGYSNGGTQYLGFGGGGAGGGEPTPYNGGNGGSGGATPGSGGVARTAYDPSSSIHDFVSQAGANGGTSAGASGAAYSIYQTLISGAGGNAYGANGGNGSSSGSGAVGFGGGGGGAGGSAGKAGVHLVLSAPVVTINGTVILSGTAGQKGGNGGTYSSPGISSPAAHLAGSGGGGGGGGDAGDLIVYYESAYNNTGTVTQTGGAGGASGTGFQNGGAGTAGSAGSINVFAITTEDKTQIGKAHIVSLPSDAAVGVYGGGWGTFAFGQIFGGEASAGGGIVYTKTQTGISSIRKEALQTITGVTRIQKTLSQTQTGVARIDYIISKDQAGKARIANTYERTQIGKAAILNEKQKSQTGVASILVTSLQNISGKSYIYTITTFPGDFTSTDGSYTIGTISTGDLTGDDIVDSSTYTKAFNQEGGFTEASVDETGVYR